MKKIVVASDSFKGSLTSAQVSKAVSEGIHDVCPDCAVVCMEVADGGEGTTDALMRVLGGRRTQVSVHDPLMRPLMASYGISDDGSTAIMEMSAASGLPLLRADERNPLLTSTFGTGEMIADALRKGCRRFLVGLGGSATNDGGTGMLEALGARFLDIHGNQLHGRGASLRLIADADLSEMLPELKNAEFTAACDVGNPLCGPDGAAAVFAPQKGAGKQQVEELDCGLRNFAAVTLNVRGLDILDVKGAGAAGGMGGGMLGYLDARLKPGAEMVLDEAGFDREAADADLVITGEGKIDAQTGMGKVPGIVLRRASSMGVPVAALAGKVELRSNPGFMKIAAVTPDDCPSEIAMKPEIAYENVRRTAAELLCWCSRHQWNVV